MEDLRRVTSRQAWIMELIPASSGAALLSIPDIEPELTFDVQVEYQILLGLLKACGVGRIRLQHLLGHDLDIHRLQRDLNVPFDCSVHDYRSICPQITLPDPAGQYCGEPDQAECNRCLALRPPAPKMDIDEWRLRQQWQLLEANRVIAPSRDGAVRMQRWFADVKVLTVPHPEFMAPIEVKAERLSENTPLRIGVLGLMSPTKGLRRLTAAAERYRKRGLPLEFVLIGSVDQGIRKESFRVTGAYRRGDLPLIFRQVAPHLIWFPAQWPETFSHTLSTCLELGLPVVAPNIGAFVERTPKRPSTWVMPSDMKPVDTVEFFVALSADAFVMGNPPVTGGVAANAGRGGFYPTEYLGRRTGGQR